MTGVQTCALPISWEVLKSFDLSKGRVNPVTINTNNLAEGTYMVKAVLAYLIDGLDNEKESDQGSFVVDRVLPTAQITYPDKSLMICPIKRSTSGGEWYGVPVEGIAEDNTGVKGYKLYYGPGDKSDNWLPAMTLNQDGKNIQIGRASCRERV